MDVQPRLRKAALRAAGPLATLALLTGCSQLSPGTAAEVNGQRITMTEVSDLAEAQCAAAASQAQGQAGGSLPRAQVQQRSLGLLLETEITEQYAEDEGLEADPRLVDAFWSQYRTSIEGLPEQPATVLSEVFRDFSLVRALLVEAGARSSGQQPSVENLQALTQAGLQVRQQWLDRAEVRTDPRFAPDADGYPGAGDSSVSRPVSDFARSASSQQPDPEWVSGLPARQKCG